MKTSVTIGIAILVLLLLAGVFFVKPWMGSPRDQERASGYVIGFSIGSVEGLEIERDGTTLEIQRVGDSWKIGPAPSDSASVQTISKILSLAQNLQILDRIPGREFGRQLDSADFGFEPPKQRLLIELPEGTREIAFGREALVPGRVFARIDGKPETYVVPADLQELLLAPTEEFRDARLVHLPASRIERLRLEREQGEIDLERRGEEWRILRPLQARAESAEVDRLLEQLLGARIWTFRDGEPQSGAADWDGEILLWEEGSDKPLRIRVGRQAEGRTEVFHSGRNLAAEVSPENLEIAFVPLRLLRARSLAGFLPDLVDRFSVTGPEDAAVEFHRSTDGDWTAARDSAVPSPSIPDVDRFFSKVSSIEVLNYLPTSTNNLAETLETPPDYVVEFNSWVSENTPEARAGLHPVARMRFWEEPEATLLVLVDEQPEFRRVGPEAKAILDSFLSPGQRDPSDSSAQFDPTDPSDPE